MTIQENLGALGSWELDLLPTIPREHLDALRFFGHIAIIPGRVDPATYGDSLLAQGVARYVGVLRGNSLADDARTNAPNDNIKISGVGLAFWLGDEDNKGAVIENATTFASGSTFPDVIRGLLPSSGAVTEGTLYSVPGTYSGSHQWVTPAQAIQYVCDTMSSPSMPVNWRVNNDGTLDAGPAADLFVTDPTCAIVARGGGEDMALRGVPGSMNLTSDMKDYTTRVVLLAQGDGASIATGSAHIPDDNIPYTDLHGNPIRLTRMVSESDTSAVNADTRAQLALAQYEGPNRDLQLGIQDYDVDGVFALGDYIYAYDPDKGLVDLHQEIVFRGQHLNPITLQVVGIQWPVTAEYTVAYRGADGAWLDLTDHVEINDAGTYVTVGDFSRQLTGGSTEPVGSRPSQDTSVPGVPVFVEPFQGTAYLDARGFTRSRVVVAWTAPLNVDGSTIRDGDHYEIRYGIDTDQIYPASWAQVSQIRWEDMQSWGQPFAAPDSEWQTMVVGWDQSTAQLQDLSTGVGYDVQIRAVDSSGNVGQWSATTTFVATEDNIPPSTPAAPSVASSRIAVQVTHMLGRATGGMFNLEADLDHLEIHAQYEPNFTPTDATLLGKLKANAGMISAGIPAVGTYQVEQVGAVYVRVVAVDISGNRSGASDAAQSSALLIDDAHISDLTVSKVTAGTVTASWVMAGEIVTAQSGARARLSSAGIELYNNAGTRTLFGDAATGNVNITGEVNSGTSGNRIVINPGNAGLPTIRFYANTGTDYAFINGVSSGSDVQLGMNSSQFTHASDTLTSRMFLSVSGATIETIDSTTQVQKGGFATSSADSLLAGYAYNGTVSGRLFIDSNQVFLGWHDTGSDEQTWLMDGANSVTAHFGTWPNFSDLGSHQGIFSGTTIASAGTGYTIFFGATRISNVVAVASCAASSYPSTGPAWAVTSSPGTVSFSVGWNTSVSAMRINFWAFRV